MDQSPDDPGDREADARLIQRALIDPEAFGVFYERFYDMILNYAFRRTLDIASAEEVTSNTFFKALRGLPQYRAGGRERQGGEPVRAWLYAIAGNELRMHWRWRRRHPAMSLSDLDASQQSRIVFAGEGALDRQLRREECEERLTEFARLHQAMARLPERFATVVALRYFERLSLEQIAKITKVPLGSVKSRLHRATARLRRLLEGTAAATTVAGARATSESNALLHEVAAPARASS